jgi:hypothetical protein
MNYDGSTKSKRGSKRGVIREIKGRMFLGQRIVWGFLGALDYLTKRW